MTPRRMPSHRRMRLPLPLCVVHPSLTVVMLVRSVVRT
jgi:hypothetical protein